MSEKSIITTIDLANSTIKLAGLKKEISIAYSADVEFTDLVSVLIDSIEDREKINFVVPEADDEKLKLVLQTIQEIFVKYNDLFEDPPSSELSSNEFVDLPF